MTVAADTLPLRWGWLRSREFDLRFTVGLAALALTCGALAVSDQRWFRVILSLDLWLLGYHHVVSTYTRLCFDRESFREHRMLVTALPIAVLAVVLALAWGVGLWALATTYLYWQWFHYTRQSWGVSQVYKRKAGGVVENERLARLAFYLLPLWGILHRSSQDPGRFLGMELRVLPVPDAVVLVTGLAALAGLGWWAATRFLLWRRGELPAAHTLYLSTHFLVFYAGYLWIENVDCGWLVLNVWHNAQYVLFVWLYNTGRFKRGLDPNSRFLSRLSQPESGPRYFALCLAISTAVYLAIDHFAASLVLAMVIYQTINFHHYIVDGLIWKVRRPKLRQTLGLSDA